MLMRFLLPLVWAFTLRASVVHMAGTRGTSSVLILKVQDATRLGVDLFVLGKGQDPTYYHDGPLTLIESYLAFDPQGEGAFVPATKAGVTALYTKRLSEFPTDPHDPSLRVLRIPKTIGGRLYFSLAEPVSLAVVEGRDASGKAVTLTLAEPDPFQPADPSFLVVYDKVEFTFNDLGVWIDTTAVDFFSLPLSLAFEGRPETAVGLARPRAAVLEVLDTALQGPWAALQLQYPNPDGRPAVLRVVAPNKAIGHKAEKENFPSDYLDPYIAAVWAYYQAGGTDPSGPVLRVDCSELVGFAYPLSDVKGGRLTHRTALYVGRVTPDGVFRFLNANADEVRVPRPQSNQVLGCDGGPMTCVPNTAAAVVVRELGAAMTVGLLPLPNQATDPATGQLTDVALNRAFFTRPDVKQRFYTNSPLLPPLPPAEWYNVYAKALHALHDKVYAFAFDDAVGEDSTLHSSDDDPSVPDVSTPYVVVVGDLTGTVLPNLTDDTLYAVTLVPGWGGRGTFTFPDGHTDSFAWPQSLVAKDVRSPFTFSYDCGSGLDQYEVTPVARRVRCTSNPRRITLGVDWDVHGSTLLLALEGKPK